MALQKEAFHQASPSEPFLVNCWYVAARDHELIDGRRLARTPLDRPVVPYRRESGKVVALDQRCGRRGARPSQGRRGARGPGAWVEAAFRDSREGWGTLVRRSRWR